MVVLKVTYGEIDQDGKTVTNAEKPKPQTLRILLRRLRTPKTGGCKSWYSFTILELVHLYHSAAYGVKESICKALV